MSNLYTIRSVITRYGAEFYVEGEEDNIGFRPALTCMVDLRLIDEAPWQIFHRSIAFNVPWKDRELYPDMLEALEALMDSDYEPWERSIIERDQERINDIIEQQRLRAERRARRAAEIESRADQSRYYQNHQPENESPF